MASKRLLWAITLAAVGSILSWPQDSVLEGGLSGLSFVGAAQAREDGSEGKGGATIRRRFLMLPGINLNEIVTTLDEVREAVHADHRVTLSVSGLTAQQTRLIVRYIQRFPSNHTFAVSTATFIIERALSVDMTKQKNKDALRRRVDTWIKNHQYTHDFLTERLARAAAENRPDEVGRVSILLHQSAVYFQFLREFRDTID